MPRIRKKTTKRGTTNQREKIKHKAREQRKKNKKEAKKNPQWKSKHTKDPGIPNNFPFKDEILAQVAEQRRKVEEDKARRKEAKKAAKTAAAQGPAEDAVSDDGEVSDSELDGVSHITVGTSSGSTTKAKTVPSVANAEEEAPALINPDLPHLQAVLDQADVVVELLDARNPLPYRSTVLESAAMSKTGRKTLLVLSKIDGIPREAASSWTTHLRVEHPTVLFRSASAFLPHDTSADSKGKGKAPANDAFGASAVLTCLTAWAAEKSEDVPLTVAVIGLTNSGKSAFINSLVRRAAIPVYKLPSLSSPSHSPTTTEHPYEVSLEVGGKSIRLIDTPGLSFEPTSGDDAEKARVRDILVRSKGRIDRLKDPVPPVAEIVSHANTEDLMLFYNLPAFSKGDVNAFLAALARANGLVKKGGVLDLANAARIVLRDWSMGKFPRYTTPPVSTSAPTATPPSDEVLSAAYSKDEAVLATLPTRKELRKGTGVVRLTPGETDTRPISLLTPWIRVHSRIKSDSEGDENDVASEPEESDEEKQDEAEDEVDEDGAEDEDEEGEDKNLLVPPPPPSGKRKQREKSTFERPSKKVAFSGAASKPTKSVKSDTPLKSALKKAARPTVKAKATAPKQSKVSNAPARKTKTSKDGEELYDFTKFF